MARLEDLRQAFLPLSWADKLLFVEAYRAKRFADLTTVCEFDLSKSAKKERVKKEPKPKAAKKAKPKLDLSGRSEEELELLRKLGVLK